MPKQEILVLPTIFIFVASYLPLARRHVETIARFIEWEIFFMYDFELGSPSWILFLLVEKLSLPELHLYVCGWKWNACDKRNEKR